MESVAQKMNRRLQPRLPCAFDAVQFDADFLAMLTMPIRRGGHCGVVGNGAMLLKIKILLDEAMTLGLIILEIL